MAYGEVYQQKAELLQSWLKKANIRMSLKFMDHATYLAQTRGNTFDLTFRNKAMAGDIDSYIYGVFHPTSPNNYGGVNDPELTKLVEQTRKETDPAKQKAIAEQVQLRVIDYPTHAILGQFTQATGFRANISGLLHSPSLALWNIEKK